MTPINNLDVYNERMRKGLLDKLWWLDKIDDNIKDIVDYGCADGALLSMVHEINPNLQLYGYDFSQQMIDLATANVRDGHFGTDLIGLTNDILGSNSVLVASSVFHEIENYSENVDKEYRDIFCGGYKYIAIRDMFLSEKSCGTSNQLNAAKVRQQYNHDKIKEFEYHIGSLDCNENLLQFFLTYRYTENWDREVRENYFPYTLEQFLYRIPNNYEIVYFEHYTLPFIQEQVFKDFGVQLQDPTHGKILLRLKENCK